MDLRMPEMDGYEFIRVFSRESETPIILLTAKADVTSRLEGLECGADAYLAKPFDFDTVRHKPASPGIRSEVQ